MEKIFFAGIITALIGAGLGFVIAKLAEPPYTSKYYRNLDRVYVIVCGTGGLLFGMSQEALRQLKVERDLEEMKKRQKYEKNNEDNTFEE